MLLPQNCQVYVLKEDSYYQFSFRIINYCFTVFICIWFKEACFSVTDDSHDISPI